METSHSIYTNFTVSIEELWKAIPEDMEKVVFTELGIPNDYVIDDSAYDDGKLILYGNKDLGNGPKANITLQ